MTPQQLAVYRYAKELNETKRVCDSTYAAALEAVGSEQALIDYVFTMGFYHQMSITLNSFPTPSFDPQRLAHSSKQSYIDAFFYTASLHIGNNFVI